MILVLGTLLLAGQLDPILDNPKLGGAIVSCVVADESGALIYRRGEGTRVMPGSNQKLLSNSFALFKLGPDFQPETRIWKLRDRVVVDCPGDPMMTHQKLEQAAKTLKLNGRQRVEVREAYRPLIPPGWEWDDLPNKYAAPVTAFTVDRGSIELWGDKDRLWLEPRNYGLRIVNTPGSGARKVIYDPVRRSLTMQGALPKDKMRLDTLALDFPDAAAASYLGRAFVLTEQIPANPPSLTIGGPPLAATIKECLVNSDNNIAENLLLMAAAKPTYEEAAKVLDSFLVDIVGAVPGDFGPQDGSGMSRHNIVTTRGIVKLLQWARAQPTRELWLDALAKPGAGTLSERLKDVPFVGKTGTLDMVVALSGYVHTKTGRDLTVSLILNHFACTAKEARQIADDFVRMLADDPFGTESAVMIRHEARPAHPRSLAVDVDRHRRSRHDGAAARERADRRAQSPHALLYRAQ